MAIQSFQVAKMAHLTFQCGQLLFNFLMLGNEFGLSKNLDIVSAALKSSNER